MSTFDSIVDYVVMFAKHPPHPDAHTSLNIWYSSNLPDIEKLFTDPTTKTMLKPDLDLLQYIKASIALQLIVPYATETPIQALPNIQRVINASAVIVELWP